MRRLAPLLACLASCAPKPPEVTLNHRQADEPATISRALDDTERAEIVEIMRSARPTAQAMSPLVTAPENGRWRDLDAAANAGVKRCEVAIVRQRAVPGGRVFELRGIADQPGEMRVTGDEASGVTGIVVSMGVFGEQTQLAERVHQSCVLELRRFAAIPRPQ